MTYKIGTNRLTIDLMSLALLVAHIKLNPNVLRFFFPKVDDNGQERRKINTRQVHHYKLRFRTKTMEDLKRISEDQDMTKEAQQAALEMIEEMKNG
ncbi:MAG: hypothetical protein HRT74_02585 [Flavobacteriales bacterium]|nr:hypothetical protein [Flavobacteriales bacterium]